MQADQCMKTVQAKRLWGMAADFYQDPENPSGNMKPLANFDDAVNPGDHVTGAEDKLSPSLPLTPPCLPQIKACIYASFLASRDTSERAETVPE